jgi:hypothetical protein
MSPIRAALLLAVLALPTPSTAAKVCLSDATNEVFYEFAKLKVPKKGNAAASVVGLAFSATSVNALPVSGTIIRDANTGSLFLGLTRFFQLCLVNAVLDDTLNGTVAYDCNLDGATEGSVTLTAVACPG